MKLNSVIYHYLKTSNIFFIFAVHITVNIQTSTAAASFKVYSKSCEVVSATKLKIERLNGMPNSQFTIYDSVFSKIVIIKNRISDILKNN